MANANATGKRSLDTINLILGCWLLIAPWVMGLGGNNPNTWTQMIFGVCTIVVSLWGISAAASLSSEWCNTILGALLFISPWVVGFSGVAAAAWSAWLVGLALVILSLINMPIATSAAHSH